MHFACVASVGLGAGRTFHMRYSNVMHIFRCLCNLEDAVYLVINHTLMVVYAFDQVVMTDGMVVMTDNMCT